MGTRLIAGALFVAAGASIGMASPAQADISVAVNDKTVVQRGTARAVPGGPQTMAIAIGKNSYAYATRLERPPAQVQGHGPSPSAKVPALQPK